MEELDAIIKNRKVNFKSLISYGFKENENDYEYHTNLKDNQFELIIKFSKTREMKTKVIDLITREEYLLINVKSATGEFVGKIRKEYTNQIKDIFEKCTEIEVFKSKMAKEVIKYIKQKYEDDPEFLWAKFEGNAVFRHKENKKWYGALLTVSKRKLGLESDEIIEILDLRNAPEEIKELVDGRKYFPGYHMNKKHWFTILLDGSVQMKEIEKFIDISFGMK